MRTKRPNVDWRRLEQFRVVARLQHVTQAAELLGTSQPALSRGLARLESELGISLFARTGRSIRLTHHGQRFYRRVERALREIDDGVRELIDLTDLRGGVIGIGFLRTLGVEYVPWLVRRFMEIHPGVEYTFMPSRGNALKQRLAGGDVDLGFGVMPTEKSPFAWACVGMQELVLIVSKHHRLARCKEIALKEAASETFVAFGSGALTERLCGAAGFKPTIAFVDVDSSSVPGFVAAGFAVAIAPRESGRFEGVVSLKISEPCGQRAISVAWVDERYLPASARALRDLAIAEYLAGQEILTSPGT